MQKLDRFVFTSDYPVDKIAWLKEIELTMDSRGKAQEVYQTGIDKKIFLEGIISFDDWVTCTPMTQNNYGDDQVQSILVIGNGLFAIIVTPLGDNPDIANKTAKIRIWGYMAEEDAKNIDTGKTANASKEPLSLNTDNIYPRLAQEGYTRTGEVITHNLGKIPTVLYWWEVDEEGDEWQYDTFTDYEARKNTIVFTREKSDKPVNIYYRIYIS